MSELDLHNMTVPGLARAAAERFGDATALEEDGRAISFRELDRLRLQAATALSGLGVTHGDRVAVWAPNIGEWVIAALGAQSLGAILVPLNTRLKGREAAYILQRSAARVLLTVRDFLDMDYPAMLEGQSLPALQHVVLLRNARDGDRDWQRMMAEAEPMDESALPSISPEDMSDMMFTSGTTGQPKGVLTTHGQNLRTMGTWSEVVGLAAGDRYLVVNPFFHTFGYKAGWLASLIRGATIIPHQVFDAESVLERIANERITMLPGPPTLYQSIMASPRFAEADVSSLRLAVTGAASVPVELVRRMWREMGFDVVLTAYGLTECCGVVTMCRQDDDAETIATTCGRAIPGVEVRCVDDANQPVAAGEPGEVVVRGYNVMSGYYQDPVATGEALDEEGWLHTGDIGVMDERGYLRITDRKKDMFVVGGFNCYPAEIENIITSHPDVVQVAVVGIPDERMGEVGKAFVRLREGAQLDEDALIAWCRENMANYKVPRSVELVQELPTNASGKIMKYVLREEQAGS